MICSYIHQGAELVVTNMDRALPVQNKSLLIPDVGAMIQSVLYCTNSEISKEIGKPSKFALDVIREEVKDVEPRKCVMVGDNVYFFVVV